MRRENSFCLFVYKKEKPLALPLFIFRLSCLFAYRQSTNYGHCKNVTPACQKYKNVPTKHGFLKFKIIFWFYFNTQTSKHVRFTLKIEDNNLAYHCKCIKS